MTLETIDPISVYFYYVLYICQEVVNDERTNVCYIHATNDEDYTQESKILVQYPVHLY